MKRFIGLLLLGHLLFCLSAVNQADPNQNATLWLQSSSEYRALASSIYASAAAQLPEALADTRWSAALEQVAGYEGLAPAVILDIDETVLDNSPYQASLIEAKSDFASSTWDNWISMASAKAIPGAVDFINTAVRLGIKVYYVSNRACTRRENVADHCPQLADTLRNLSRLGFPEVPAEQLLLKHKREDWGSEKQSRREEIVKTHRVVMLFGDDLGDFLPGVKLPRALRDDPERVAEMLEQRNQQVAANQARWGTQWFMLPNPSYGSWLSMIKAEPARYLRPDPLITALMTRAGGPALPSEESVSPCQGREIAIHTIQGDRDKSQLEGQEVTTAGVVTARNTTGYFLAELAADENPATSEGLYIYDRAHTPAIGDHLSVTGKVTEHPTPASRPRSYETELSAVSCFKTLGKKDPPQYVIEWPVESGVSLERYEGMSITLPGPLFVTGTSKLGRYGDLLLSKSDRLYSPTHTHAIGEGAEAVDGLNARNRLVVDDGLPGTFPNETRFPQGGLAGDHTLRLGYRAATITGVVRDSYGDYRIIPESGFRLQPANLRPSAPARLQAQSLRAAAFNVRNYFYAEEDVALQGSRGAQTLVDLKRQTAKLVAAIRELDADILGLVEIENSALNQAAGPLSQLLTAVNSGIPTDKHYVAYDVGVDRLGSDEIAVAFAYRPARISVLTLEEGERFGPTALPEHQTRPSVVGYFQDKVSGESLLAVVNHFKSKRPSCGPDRHPLSGGCNQVRTEMARQLQDWISTIAARHQIENLLILGDLNAHKHESPLQVLRDAGYQDLLDNPQVARSGDYTHVHHGQSARLDYLMGSDALAAKVSQALIWHINADEPDVLDYQSRYYEPGREFDDRTPKPNRLFDPGPYRSSDHDPVLVDLNLHSGGVVDPVAERPEDTPPTPPVTLKGAELRQWLKANWYDGHHTDLGYSLARVEMYSHIDVAEDGQVYGIYSGFSQEGKATTFLNPINAEHTVPQSWFGKKSPMRSDLHHLFPTHKSVNSARGSLPFGDIEDRRSDKWFGIASQFGALQVVAGALPPLAVRDGFSEYDKNVAFEPPEDHKGDTARAIFYFYTMYPTQAGGIERIIESGELESLYQWHQDDPVVAPGGEPATSWEWQRNRRIAGKQGNFNPYVTHPEWVCRAWEIRNCED
jgi:5'-nucleotidase (lipoprotein e(P4) family)